MHDIFPGCVHNIFSNICACNPKSCVVVRSPRMFWATQCHIATFFLMAPNPLKSYVFFGTTLPYQITLGHMVEYDKKLFLSIQWVCKWRRGARKHLQTCLQAFGTTLRIICTTIYMDLYCGGTKKT